MTWFTFAILMHGGNIYITWLVIRHFKGCILILTKWILQNLKENIISTKVHWFKAFNLLRSFHVPLSLFSSEFAPQSLFALLPIFYLIFWGRENIDLPSPCFSCQKFSPFTLDCLNTQYLSPLCTHFMDGGSLFSMTLGSAFTLIFVSFLWHPIFDK